MNEPIGNLPKQSEIEQSETKTKKLTSKSVAI